MEERIREAKTAMEQAKTEEDRTIEWARTCEFEAEQERLARAARLRDKELQDFQEGCEHVFVDDLIDIDPDRSVATRYCVKCYYCEIESEKERVSTEMRDLQDSCEHVFVDDLIDIDPDRSVATRYCVKCYYCN